MKSKRAFTLMEMLVVIAIIGILAALLVSAVGSTKSKARRVDCANNLSQISVGLRMYSDDSADKAPRSPNLKNTYVPNFTSFKKVVKNDLGLNGESSRFKDAQCNVSFVDGHVNYSKIYWESAYSPTAAFDPPSGYDYQWSGE